MLTKVKSFINGWVHSWLTRPASMVSGWFAAAWAANLIPATDAVAIVHKQMELVAPLSVYGLAAGSVFLSYYLSARGAHFIHGKWPVWGAHLLACGFWTFVAVLFIASGASKTGWGIYTVTAFVTGVHALFSRGVQHARVD